MITVENLIKDALKIKKETTEVVTEQYPVERLNDEITIHSIDLERFTDITEGCKNKYTIAKKACYEGIEGMKDKNLWKAYGVSISNPYEIVKEIFKPYEYEAIANKILVISGFSKPIGAKEAQETVKN